MEQKKQLKPRPKIVLSEKEMKIVLATCQASLEARRQYQEALAYREKRIKETMERILRKQNGNG